MKLFEHFIQVAGGMQDAHNRNLSGPQAIKDHVVAGGEASHFFFQLGTFAAGPRIFCKDFEKFDQAVVEQDSGIDVILCDVYQYFINVLPGPTGERVFSHFAASI